MGEREITEPRRELSKGTVLVVLYAAIALLLLTHTGARSPYSYVWALFDGPAYRLFGSVVNPDARFAVPVTMFFYQPASIDYGVAYNLNLPLHSFLTAIFMGLTRSFLVASYITNLVMAWLLALAGVNLADQAGLSRRAILVAGLTFFSLPLWVEYLGQPMQYAAAAATNMLVMLIALALVRRGTATPVNLGILAAVLLMSYDWYAFAAALFAFLFFRRRAHSLRDIAVFLTIAVAPAAIWKCFLLAVSRGYISDEIRNKFLLDQAAMWIQFVQEPGDRIVRLFTVTHAGLQIGFAEVMAMVYWPLLAVCVVALYVSRSSEPSTEATRLIGFVALFYVIEQLFTAAFDWENNPRRAIPMVFVFGVAYAVCVHRLIQRRVWASLFVALLVMTAVLSYADTLFRNAAIMYLNSGQAVRAAPKGVLDAERRKLTGDQLPALMDDQQIEWSKPGRAKVEDRSILPIFAVGQLGALALMMVLLWSASRATILPRNSPVVFAAIWAISIVVRWI